MRDPHNLSLLSDKKVIQPCRCRLEHNMKSVAYEVRGSVVIDFFSNCFRYSTGANVVIG